MKLEIDAGCSLTVLNEDAFKELRKKWKKLKTKTGMKLETFTGQQIEVRGTCQVEYQEYCGVPRVKENTPYYCSDWQWFKLAG